MTTSIKQAILVPAGTIVSAKGDGQLVDVSAVPSQAFLVTLSITNIIEQESLDLSIYGSPDGTTRSSPQNTCRCFHGTCFLNSMPSTV